MFKRKIDKVLQEWKADNNHKPLVIKGVRQCGKTSSVKAFAYKEYKNIIYIDFHEHREYKTFFAGALDVDTIMMNISVGIKGITFEAGNTCIILDEIQNCPSARAALKFFKLDGRYDVICTGSLLGVNGYKTREEQREEEEASIPVGFEHIVNMYPMDFEEWLWANGIEQQHIEYLQKCMNEAVPVTEAIHNRMRQLMLHYIVVGGMPEAVSAYFDTNNMNKVIEVQREILETYKTDMVKYAQPYDKVRIRECFESIPAQLARENKKFSYALIKKGSRASQYDNCLQWIEDAGIIRRCYNMHITELPLEGNAIKESFKVYVADTGLFIAMLEDGTQWSVLQGYLHSYKGAIYENVLADILGKMGRKLYYYHKESGIELDFILRYRGECTPLECKARTGNAKSLKTVFKHPEKYHVAHALKVGDYNVGRTEQLLTLPFYMAFLLTDF